MFPSPSALSLQLSTSLGKGQGLTTLRLPGPLVREATMKLRDDRHHPAAPQGSRITQLNESRMAQTTPLGNPLLPTRNHGQPSCKCRDE